MQQRVTLQFRARLRVDEHAVELPLASSIDVFDLRRPRQAAATVGAEDEDLLGLAVETASDKELTGYVAEKSDFVLGYLMAGILMVGAGVFVLAFKR